MNQSAFSSVDPYQRKRVQVLDTEMAYVDTGTGDPIVFLHGNPTSSYLWRNIIPHVESLGRCLAPDLIGMGESGKMPNGSYRFREHARYLDAWFDTLGLGGEVTLVLHDWGSALGFYWAMRHPERVNGLAYMEAIVRPLTWNEWPESSRSFFRALRSPAGEEMILQKNLFIERVLPGSILRPLAEEELEVYRQPYREPGESRRPMLVWPREIPLDGEPADVTQIVADYATWMASTPIPKLLIHGVPGSILVGAQRSFCRTWPNQREISVQGLHFLQEDSPHEIGEALADFIKEIRRPPQ